MEVKRLNVDYQIYRTKVVGREKDGWVYGTNLTVSKTTINISGLLAGEGEDIRLNGESIYRPQTDRFTGFTAKNEVPLFTRDIVRLGNDGKKALITCNRGAYGYRIEGEAKTIPFIEVPDALIDTFEVIGNLVENPELWNDR